MTPKPSAAAPPIWTRPPFKRIYVTVMLLTVLLRAPWWTVSSLLPSWRPISRWSFRQTVSFKFLRFVLRLDARVKGMSKRPDHLALQLGKGVLGIYVDAVPELIHGELKEWVRLAAVEPVRLPGYWIHKRGASMVMGAKPAPGEKVVYFLHGGAYVGLSAHPSAPTSNIPRLLLKHCPRIERTFAIEYRLSAGPPRAAFPFPAALTDALAGYNYLVNTVGFAPENIIVVGDSAGGNLALALTRYLVEYASELSTAFTARPSPGAQLLLSPWTDLSTAHHRNAESSIHRCQSTDYLVGPTLGQQASTTDNYAARAFVGPHGFDTAAFTNPYISPGSPNIPEGKGSFVGFPKTLIVAGDAELLVDQIRVVKEKMASDIGDDVVYFEARDAVHDFLIFKWHESGRKETLEAIEKWVAAL